MSVRKRGDRFQVRVSTPSGRIERTLPAGATRKDAEAYEARLKLEAVGVLVGKRVDPRLDVLVLRYLENEARGLDDYRKQLLLSRALQPFFAGRRLSQIVEVCDEVKRAKRREGRTNSTINRHLALLRRVANLAFSVWGVVDQNWGAKVKLLPENPSRLIFLSPEQVHALATAIVESGGDCAEDAAGAVLLASMSGMRRGELLRLRELAQAGLETLQGDVLIARKTKTGKPRAIPLPPGGLNVAKRWIASSITDHQLRYRFEEGRAAAGMQHVRFNDLRHTYATWMLNVAKAPTVVVRDLLGHASISTTNKYVHADIEHARRAVKRMKVGSGLGQKPARKRPKKP